MKHGLQWGGLQGENKREEPLSIVDYRNMFPKYAWAVIDDTPEMERVAHVHRAMTHPLTKAFVEYVLRNYTPSPKKRLLLILPCSKAKPYSLSPSYLSLYRPLIFLFVGRDIKDEKCPIDVLVMSGLIGPVPLELEEYAPASNYDFSLNTLVNVPGAHELYQLLAKRMAVYLKRVLGYYEAAYSLVNEVYKTVIELALKQLQIQNRDALKKIHMVSVSPSNFSTLVELMICLKNMLYPSDKSTLEVKNRHYFDALKKRLKVASKIICQVDTRLLG